MKKDRWSYLDFGLNGTDNGSGSGSGTGNGTCSGGTRDLEHAFYKQGRLSDGTLRPFIPDLQVCGCSGDML